MNGQVDNESSKGTIHYFSPSIIATTNLGGKCAAGILVIYKGPHQQQQLGAVRYTRAMLSLLLFLFLHALPGKAQPGHTSIQVAADSSISLSTPLVSPSGNFAFGFYAEGDGGDRLAIGTWLWAEPDVVIWTWNRDNQTVSSDATLKLDAKGLQLLQRDGDQHLFVLSNTTFASRATLLDSGNLVISDFKDDILWQTSDYPTDTIIVNQSLATGEQLVSSLSDTNHSSGRFRMKMQSDGNLVMYPVDTLDTATDAYWASNTAPNPRPTSLLLDGNGSLSLFTGCDCSSYVFWNNPTHSPSAVYFARFEPDGVLRLYSLDGKSNRKKLHQIPSGDECEIKGACGMNSYCDSSAGGVKCLCLPGFDYVDKNRTYAGCQRNFSEKAVCPEGDTPYYYMSTLSNTTWWDDPYQSPQSSSSSSEDECRDACLNRCDCYASLFDPVQGRCSKQRPPFMYARTGKDVNTKAFLKVGTPQLPTEKLSQVIKRREPSSSLLAILAAVVCVLPVAAAPILFLPCQNRVKKCHEQWKLMEKSKEKEMGPESFTFLQLREATGNFKSEKIGSDGALVVFKGTLPRKDKEGNDCNLDVAVKRLDKVAKEADGMFQAEMMVAGRTYHRNLVQLVGFCNEGSKRLLVYEYMSRGSLADLIFKEQSNPPCWDKRVGIIFDVARAIHYLHEECESLIIHRNIDAQNIFLDERGTAKLSDFGKAKLLMNPTTSKQEGGAEERSTAPMSTTSKQEGGGEGSSNALISTTSEHERGKDVYSFGKVLLEIVYWRSFNGNDEDWKRLMARELKLTPLEDIEMQKVERMVEVGHQCVLNQPTMKDVMETLEGDGEVNLLPCHLADPSRDSPSTVCICFPKW